MRLGRLKRNWNRFGRRDPFWAVLTDHDKRGGGWDLDQFFRGGADEIAGVLHRADRLGLTVSRRRALDFGCGVGRLTQAMADHFVRCDGVDIAASMLQLAQHYDRHPDRCCYHLNVAPDLAIFADASFSFVYSTLVLQHMEPRYSTGYIKELLRVLAPGGLLVFQLPSHRGAREPSATGAGTPIPGRLPAAAFKARIAADRSSLSAHAGELVTLRVTVENCSPHAWPALPDARGRYQLHLGNHWLHEDGELLHRDDARCALPHDLAPGSRAEMMLGVTAPRFDGAYWLELDLVQESANWFAEGSPEAFRIPCRVAGGLPASPGRSPLTIAGAPEPERPFRERHPGAFRVLRATGLRDAYWTWRRALDGVRGRRDRLILRLIEHVYHPVVPPLINSWRGLINWWRRLVKWWKRGPFAPTMEMHCVPRSEVLAVLAGGGGRLVDTEEELMPGDFHSRRYWVAKD